MSITKVSSLPNDFVYSNIFSRSNSVYVSGYNPTSGKKIYTKLDKIPNLSLYINTHEQTEFKSLKHGVSLKKTNFVDIAHYKKFLTDCHDARINVYGEIPLEYKWLYEFYPDDINPRFDLINIGFFDIEHEPDVVSIKPEVANKKITAITSLYTKNKTVYIQCINSFKNSEKFDILYKKIEKEAPDFKISVVEYDNDEAALLVDFCKIMNEIEMVDIISGWYSNAFDIVYIYRRLEIIFQDAGPKMLSPFNFASSQMKTDKNGKDELCVYIKGIDFIDYLDAFKKFFKTAQESYTLEYIATKFLGVGKVEKEGSFIEFYNNNYEEYIYYNFIDTKRVYDLEQKLKILKLIIMIAYSAKAKFSDAFSPVRIWDNFIHNEVLSQNIIVDPHPEQKSLMYPGAYVHTPKAGFKEWAMNWDFDSEYPHIQMGWFISPENLLEDKQVEHLFSSNESAMKTIKTIWDIRNKLPVGKDKNFDQKKWGNAVSDYIAYEWDTKLIKRFERKEFDISFLYGTDICMTPCGEFFIKNANAVMPKIMEREYNKRKKVKAVMEDFEKLEEVETDKKLKKEYKEKAVEKYIVQLTIKENLNSGYGACASKYFRYFDVRLARSITSCGRFAIRYISQFLVKKLNDYCKTDFNSWIYNDTDATYLELGVLVDLKCKGMTKNEIVNYLDKFDNEYIQTWLDEGMQEIADYFNAKKTLHMKREKISDVAIWSDISKHYIMRYLASEGVRYAEPKILLKGTNFVRSSMCAPARKKVDEFARYLMELYDKERKNIFNKKNTKLIYDWVDKFRKEFMKLDPNLIAASSSVNNIEQYSTPEFDVILGAPAGVKAACTYNKFIEKNNLIQMGFKLIQSGQKVRQLSLLAGNPYGVTADSNFGFIDRLPTGFDFKWVDFNGMFESNFGTMVNDLLQKLGFQIDINGKSQQLSDDIWG